MQKTFSFAELSYFPEDACRVLRLTFQQLSHFVIPNSLCNKELFFTANNFFSETENLTSKIISWHATNSL